MTTTILWNRFLVNIFTTLLVVATVHESFGQDSTTSQTATPPSIVELLQQRRAVLSELVRVQTKAYHQGAIEIEAVIEAREALLGAELELAADHAARIKLLEQSVHLARDLVKMAKAKHAAGRASVADVLKSRAERLGAEIALAHARQQAKQD